MAMENGLQNSGMVSAPTTPGTPAPLLAMQQRIDSASYDRTPFPTCKCVSFDSWSSPACLVDVPMPSISLSKKVGELAGIAVGATVTLNILIAGPGTGGSMNPVRTLGPAVAAGNYKQIWIYLVAPTAGALLGAAAYTIVKLKGEEGPAGLEVRPQTRATRSIRR